MILESQNAMSAADGATTEPKIRLIMQFLR